MEAVTRLALTTNISNNLSCKFEYISKYSIYPYNVRDDYNSAQCCLATQLYFLISGDAEAFLVTKILSEQLLQMRSPYIKVWLLEDFKFDRMDMMRAINTLARMVVNQHIHSYSPIVHIITGLEKKYDLEGYFVKMVIELSAHFSTAMDTVRLRFNDSKKHTSGDQQSIKNLETATSTSIATQTIVEGPCMMLETATFTSIATQPIVRGPCKKLETATSTSITTQTIGRGPLMKVALDILLSAVRSNSTRIVSMLLSEDVSDEDKGRALLEASEAGYSDIVRMLVSSGADVGFKDGFRRTSLHLAAKEGKVECVRVLLDVAGVDVDRKGGPYNGTALHYASDLGHLEVVRLLLAKGANVNSRNRDKDTPLHWAAIRGHSSVVEVLVSSGADINVINDVNKTPLYYAHRNNKHTVVNFLKSKGAH